jgi:hypothetical protein
MLAYLLTQTMLTTKNTFAGLRLATQFYPQRRTNNGFNASSLWANSICIGRIHYRNSKHSKGYIAYRVYFAGGASGGYIVSFYKLKLARSIWFKRVYYTNKCD